MKKFALAAVTISLCVFIWACQKEISWDDVNNQPAGGTFNYGVTFSGNDTAYHGCVDTAYYVTAGTARSLMIQMSDTSGNSLHFTLMSVSGTFSPGAYTFASGAASLIASVSSGTYTFGSNTSVDIQVTEISDTLVQGTFSATLVDPSTNQTFKITNGQLKALIGRTNPCGGDIPPPVTTTAAFTLVGSGTSCSNASVSGTYTVGVSLSSANTVSLQVNVTQAGTYNITTSAANGISFNGSGSFATTGTQSVVLQGSGTPATAGPTALPITVASTNCSFSVTVAPATTAAAVFNLAGSPNACANPVIQGYYYADTALTGSNKVVLDVDVTTTGSYSVTTSPVDGMTFSGSGNFTTTGPQTLTLTGSGTPTSSGGKTISIIAGGSYCDFTVLVGIGGSAPCSLAGDTAIFSNIPNISFYAISGQGSGGSYIITGNGTSGDVALEFSGVNQPAPGVYTIEPVGGNFGYGAVRASAVNQSIYWEASQGKVYVTVNNGKVTAIYCNVSMSGSLGGPSYTTVVSTRMTER